MAESLAGKEALDKLNAKLECAVCFTSYTDPKLLPCFHVFCKKCLEHMVVQDHDGLSLQCPVCCETISLPSNGVSTLQSDFHVDHLFEIRDAFEKASESQVTKCEKCEDENASGFCRDCGHFICDTCKTVHQKWKQFKSHEVISLEEVQKETTNFVQPKKQVSYCPKHPEKKLKIYCETCSELICNDCTVRFHQGHNYDLLVEIFQKHKDEIVSSLQPLEQQLSTVNKALHTFDVTAKEIQDKREAIQHDVNEEIDQLQQALEQRRAQLIGTLDQLTQHKLKSLDTQRGQVELLQVKLTSCLDYVQGGLTTGTEGEVLAMKAPVLKRIQQITTDFNIATIQPEEEADIHLMAENKQELLQACCDFAEVKLQEISSDNSYAMGDALQTATVGEQAMVTVHAVSDGKIEYNKEIDLTAELVHCNSKATKQCTVQKQGTTNQHIVIYQPTNRGKHQLHIKIDGREIQESPYTIAVTPSPQNRVKPVKVIRDLSRPNCVTRNNNNQLLVTEAGTHCVSVFSPEGRKIHSFGGKGSQEGEFICPVGVTVDADENIYVVDMGNDRIQKFTSTGKFITSVGTRGVARLQFHHPCGVCFNPNNGRLYVCDKLNHRIQVLNQDLSFHSSFGQEGSEDGELNKVIEVAINSKGEVYVSDCANSRVQVFTEDGQFLRAFSQKGHSQMLHSPTGITIDSGDTVYVNEQDMNCVSAFDPTEEHLKTFSGEGLCDHPYGLHIDLDDCLLVCDSNNDRIIVL